MENSLSEYLRMFYSQNSTRIRYKTTTTEAEAYRYWTGVDALNNQVEEKQEYKRSKSRLSPDFSDIDDRVFSAMESKEAYHKFLTDYNQVVERAPAFDDVCSIMIDNGCIVINTKEK